MIGSFAPTADLHRESIVFNAVITPHRSLSPRGLRMLFGVIAVLLAVVSLRFWYLGAWPVTLFGILEVAVVGGFLWANHRSARSVETVTLYHDRAHIERLAPSGQQWETALPMAWLTVELEERAPRVTRLWLCHRERREEIAGALGEEEKRDLAGALRKALETWRNPEFDNPQLRH